MATQTVTAMFETRADAERAADALRSALTLQPGAIHLVDQTASTATTTSGTAAGEDHGFFGSIRALFLPEEDSTTYAEGIRRGDVLLSATVEHDQASKAMDVLEQHGALDYDVREKSWRASGWQATTTATATAPMAMGSTSVGSAARSTTMGAASIGSASVAGGANDVIPLYEESVHVGKRDVSHGRVRVRTYVTETPVSELIRLRQERVTVERRPVDRAVGANEDVFRERVIEATETSEEAVVAKDIRVREEIALRKDVTTDEKTITDKVRRTEVEIENGLGTSSVRGSASVTGSTVAGAAGTTSTRAL